MRDLREHILLYAVTDQRWLRGEPLTEHVRRALEGGVTMVQLREKGLDRETYTAQARELALLCHSYGVPLIVNDSVEVALASGADGVHLGQGDMDPAEARKLLGPWAIIGVTARTVEQARAAEAAGADYLGSGAVFPTGSKGDAVPMTHETLAAICAAVSIPVAAIGGVNADNVGELAGTGISGAAAIGGIFGQPDIERAAKTLKLRVMEVVNAGKKKPAALTIAGSDSSGGAGIQADLKAMTLNGVFAMSAVTALTAQNTTGVTGILESTPEFLQQQIDAVFDDIRPDAVKIGMVFSAALIRVIGDRLRHYGAKNIVVDPVMIATSGAKLISDGAVDTLKGELLPLAALITPNIPEAEALSGLSIRSPEDMERAAKQIGDEYGCAVLCKGGHSLSDADDLLYDLGKSTWFRGVRVRNPNTHGTGCTLSSAIAANLAKGFPLPEAIRRAKDYLSGALAAMLDLGAGSGPMDHAFDLHSRFGAEAER